MSTLFVSDVHLYPSHQGNRKAFLDFLNDETESVEKLYVLGDLFHCWIGDEACYLPYYKPVIEAFRRLTQSGIQIFLIVGNRDFLLGKGFEQESGVMLLPEHSTINLYGKNVLILHGDTLCSDDREYQKFRQMVRAESWRKEFLSKSVAERSRLCDEYSEQSDLSKSKKNMDIMDATPSAVEELMRKHDVLYLIHGHTHRPGKHEFLLDGRVAHRIVLGEWYQGTSFLKCVGDDWKLVTRKRNIQKKSVNP